MTVFFQAAAAVLLACILGLVLSQQDKSMALMLILSVCCMVLVLAVHFLDPVFVFLQQLQEMGGISNELIRILMKITLITLISEIAGMICADSGNSSLSKGLHFLATSVILWLSIPVFQGLLELIQKILGGI